MAGCTRAMRNVRDAAEDKGDFSNAKRHHDGKSERRHE